MPQFQAKFLPLKGGFNLVNPPFIGDIGNNLELGGSSYSTHGRCVDVKHLLLNFPGGKREPPKKVEKNTYLIYSVKGHHPKKTPSRTNTIPRMHAISKSTLSIAGSFL